MNFSGDKSVFAIQWAEETLEDGYLYGHLCFWIGSEMVGNYEEISTLSICASFLKDFLLRKQERQLENSCSRSKEELFELLYKKFFSGSSINDTSLFSMGEIREIYWLDEVGEYSFRDKVGIILLDEPVCDRQRIIWEEFNDGKIKEHYLPYDYFEKVASDFLFRISSSN